MCEIINDQFTEVVFIRVDQVKGFSVTFGESIIIRTQNEFAVYELLLTHLARINLVLVKENEGAGLISAAKDFAEKAVEYAEQHFDVDSPFYSRRAVAYMQLAEVYIADQAYDKALPLINDACDIMLRLFGEDDPEIINTSSRKSAVLYHLGQYSEALEIGLKNLDAYTRFYGELNYLRFEQLLIVIKCYIQLQDTEQAAIYEENAMIIGKQLFAEDSKQFKELMEL